MCRHLAYLGPECSPADMLFGAPHSLRQQAHAPTHMRGGGTVNVDGFGLGWYPRGSLTPRRYRRGCPIWADETITDLATDVRTSAYLAAVRSGTPGMPFTDAACAPFADDGWLFSHNGVVRGWPDSMAELASTLGASELLRLPAPTDSALLWALLRTRLRAGEKPLDAVRGLLADVERAAPGSRLNLLLTDGYEIVATAWRHSLSVRDDADAVLVASEPCDSEPGWQPVPDGNALVAQPGVVELIPVDAED